METEHPHPHGRRNHQYGIQGFFHLGECETQPSTTDVAPTTTITPTIVISSLEMNTHTLVEAVCLLVGRKVGELFELDLPLPSSSISKVEEASALARFLNGGT